MLLKIKIISNAYQGLSLFHFSLNVVEEMLNHLLDLSHGQQLLPCRTVELRELYIEQL